MPLLKKSIVFFLLAIAILAIGLALDKKTGVVSFASRHMVSHAEKELQKKEVELSKLVDAVAVLSEDIQYKESTVSFLSERRAEIKASGMSILIYENKKLTFWSDNAVAFDENMRLFSQDHQLIHLKNGWYETIIKQHKNKNIIGLLLIKNDYAYQNKFLENEFNPVFAIPSGSEIYKIPRSDAFSIKSIKNHVLFFVSINNTANNLFSIYSLLLYLSGLLLFALSVHFFNIVLIKRHTFFFLLLSFCIVGARLLMISLETPHQLYHLSLFNPQYYASSFFLRSLGDLLLNSIIACYYVVFIHTHASAETLAKKGQRSKGVVSAAIIGWSLCIYLLIAIAHSVVRGLIINSQIPFNINNVFELNVFSVVGFIIIACLFFIIYIVIKGFVTFLNKLRLPSKSILILFFIVQGLFLLLLFLFPSSGIFNDYTTSAFILSSALIISMWYIEKEGNAEIPISRLLFILFLFSLYAARVIYTCHSLREQENRKVLARKLEKEQDPIAEHLFADIEASIKEDEALAGYFIGSPNAQEVVKRMHQFYFKGYWSKYESKIYCFDSKGNALPKSLYTDTIDYFERLISYQGTPTYSNYFYFLNNDNRISYLAKIPVSSDGRLVGTIFAEINSKFVQENGGFPELLLSEKVAYDKELSDYSYAQYIDCQLVGHFGKFNYLLNTLKFEPLDKEIEFKEIDRFNHLFYKANATKLIVISRKADSWLDYITIFSYLFTFLFLFSLIVWLFSHYEQKSFRLNFSTRIQMAVLLVVLVSLVGIGGGTIYYILNKYNTRQFEQISERVSFLSNSIEKVLEEYQRINKKDMNESVQHRLTELANNVDFNIFDLQGEMLFSSQPKIIDQGILSGKINPDAYYQLAGLQTTQYIHSENIGKLDFIAAYVPIRNIQNHIIGYLNLPYFSKQTELKKEISSFLVTLINVYMLLLVLSIIMALVISSYIAKPLKLVQEKLALIKLGKKNELIAWSEQDEIGQLINEYNRMVDELARNAGLLAKSEREGAWREMAKQVAHEIKNPLTPMKLSVQHLQRAWKDQSPNMDVTLERITKTLVQQIDTLSSIATAFSNFAQMPKANKEIVNLAIIIKDTVELFKVSDNTELFLELNTSSEQIHIYADKDQVVRAFTNLIKNAVQAISPDRQGRINVIVKESAEDYILSLQDNGTGIPNDQVEHIFTPNFTTKTGGMGLGLAMTKTIIENAGGKIWFETKVGEGTTFFVSLPKG